MNGFAKQQVTSDLASLLQKLFPSIEEVDFAVVAQELIAATDLRAVAVIGEREEAFQKALKAIMDYYTLLLDSYREEQARWDEERKALHLRLLSTKGKTPDA